MLKTPKKIANLFFALFTITTVLHSMFAVSHGTESVNHQMLLQRAILIFFTSLSYVLIKSWSSKNKVLSFVLPYIVYMGLSLGYTFTSAKVSEGDPAYLPVLLQGSVIYIIVYGFLQLPKYFKKLNLPKVNPAKSDNHSA